MEDHTQPPLNNDLSIAAFGKHSFVNFYPEEEIDLNEALHSALQKQTADKNVLSILRSDKLPLVCGHRENIVRMLDAISFMIINHPPLNSKLFLYVKCEQEPPEHEVLNLRLTPGERLYQLFFHTNITTDENWKLIYQEQLATCAVIAEENRGSFNFHTISNTGCLFSLILPGKNS